MPSCSILNKGCEGQWARGWRRLRCTSENEANNGLDEGKSRGTSDSTLWISVGVCDAGLGICDGGGWGVGGPASPSSPSSSTSVIIDVV